MDGFTSIVCVRACMCACVRVYVHACVCVCSVRSVEVVHMLMWYCVTLQVACKYISNPVLFNRPEVGLVKFDIRYMLMLRSVQPLTLYAYDVFWLRFANK